MNYVIVSFGNSTKYRMGIERDCSQVADLKVEVANYMKNRFPTLSAVNLYDRMDVVPVTDENREAYQDYQEFDSNSVAEIEKVLSREAEGFESLRNLNDNSPWSSATAKM